MFGIPQWPRWTRNGSQPTQRASEGTGAAGSPFRGLAGFHGPGCLDDLLTGPLAERPHPAVERLAVALQGLQ